MKKKIKTINIALVYFEYAILNIQRFAEKQYYIDITDEWVNNSKYSDKGIIMHAVGEMFEYMNNFYIIDGYNIVIESKNVELDIAYYISNNMNKRVEILPRFNKPDGFRTPDFKIDNKYYDYKHTTGKSNQLIFHNVQKAKGQSYNFIINILSEDLSKKEIICQINYTFRRIKWVEITCIKSRYGFSVYKRKQ